MNLASFLRGLVQRHFTSILPILLCFTFLSTIYVQGDTSPQYVPPTTYLILPSFSPEQFPVSFQSCSAQYSTSSCELVLYCLNDLNEPTPCVPYCSSCQQPQAGEQFDPQNGPYSSPRPPKSFKCGYTKPLVCQSSSCFFDLQLDMTDSNQTDPCHTLQLAAQLTQLYLKHDCSQCSPACSIHENLNNNIITSFLTDPTIQPTPPISSDAYPTTFSCNQLQDFYPQQQHCQIEAINSTGYCIQQQATYSTSITSGPNFNISINNKSNNLQYIIPPEQCTQNPVQNFQPNGLSHTYLPQVECQFHWGCSYPQQQADGSVSYTWDSLCSQCDYCRQDLVKLYTCEATITIISSDGSSHLVTEPLSSDQLAIQQIRLQYCFNPDISAQTIPPTDTCPCDYYCLSSQQLAQFGSTPPQLTQTIPPDANKITISNIDSQCFIKPTQGQIPCGNTPVQSIRQVYCTMNNIISDNALCLEASSNTQSPPPPDYSLTIPSTTLIYPDLSRDECPSQLLCRFGNDNVSPTNPFSTSSYYSPPQTSPITSTKMYPLYYFPCDQLLCRNICLESTPIVISKTCFKRSNCITITDATGNALRIECDYEQLPYTDPRCDLLDFTSIDTNPLYSITQYKSRPLPTSPPPLYNFSTFITITTCPSCNSICSPIIGSKIDIINSPRQWPTYFNPSLPFTNPTPPSPISQVGQTPVYSCSPTQPPAAGQTIDLSEYGYDQIPLPITDIAQSTAQCYQSYIRHTFLINTNTPSSPQLLPLELCTLFDPNQYSTLSPLNIDPQNLLSTNPFLCSSPLVSAITQTIPTTSSQFTCSPAFVCSSQTPPTINTDPICTNLPSDFTGYLPICAADNCGTSISRSVSCIYSANPTDNNTPRYSPTDISSKLPALVQSALSSTAFQPHISQIQALLASTLFPSLSSNCQTAPPLTSAVCTCEPMYLCGQENLNFQPQSTWSALLSPCFLQDMVTENVTPETGEGVGYPKDCPGCKDQDSSKVRDIFCRNRDGSLSYVIGQNGDGPVDTTSDCARAGRSVPISHKQCIGQIACVYDFRCPAISSSITQDNWTPSIVYEPLCSKDSTFSTACYVPAPTDPEVQTFSLFTAASLFTPFALNQSANNYSIDPKSIVIWNDTPYLPSECTSSGVNLRKVICFAYTTDQYGKIQPILSGTAYDKTCASRLVINQTSSPPSQNSPCQTYGQCECQNSISTGPDCTILPSLSSFRIATPYPQPNSSLTRNFIHVKAGTMLNIAWDYLGNSRNSIYFYLQLVSISALSNTIVIDQISPEPDQKLLNSFFLGQVPAISSPISFTIPTSLASILPTAPYQSPKKLIQLVAYIGYDYGAPTSYTYIATPYLHILPHVVSCGNFICTQANLKIYDSISSTLAYDWSNSVEACEYKTSQSTIGEQTHSPISAINSLNTDPAITVPEPTSIYSLNANYVITGCSCVVSATLAIDPTCTFSISCQDLIFSTTKNNPLQVHIHTSTPLISSMTMHNVNRKQSTEIDNDDLPFFLQDGNPQQSRQQIGSPIDVDPTGTCGSNGFIPLQHRWNPIPSISLPPSCSPECQCINPFFTPESKCTTCTRTCNFPSDGGTLNSTACVCSCNIGFYGDSCTLCATYALFTIEALSSQFVNQIYENTNLNATYFTSLATQIASVLQLSAKSVFIDPQTIYMRSSTLKFIVTIAGNCSTNPTPFSSLESSSPANTSSKPPGDMLYSSTPFNTSIFSIFPRWEALLQYYTAMQTAQPFIQSTTSIVISKAKVFIKSSPTTKFLVSNINAILSAFSSPPLSRSTYISSHRAVSNSSTPSMFTTSTSTITPTTTTSTPVTTQTVSLSDPYYQFYSSGLLSQTGGKPSLGPLYAPKCVGSACPTGDNPFDSVHCVLSGECIVKPNVDNREEILDDSVLYIVIAIVAFILITLVLVIIIFCFCSSQDKDDVPPPDDEEPIQDPEDIFQHDTNSDATLTTSTSHHTDASMIGQGDAYGSPLYHSAHLQAPATLFDIDQSKMINPDSDDEDDDAQYQHNMLHQADGEVEMVNF